MKNIIKLIIAISLIFSIKNGNYVSADYIEDLLNLDTGIEEYKLDLAEIKTVNLKSENYNKMQDKLKAIDTYMKNGIIRMYKSGEYGYYQTQGLVLNYNNFIFYINNFLYYLQKKEYYPNMVGLDDEILKNYKNIKIYYEKVNNLTNKRGLN